MGIRFKFNIKAICAVALCAVMLVGCGSSSSSQSDFTSIPQNQDQAEQPVQPTGSDLPYRALWFSYLDWASIDTSNAQAFTQTIGAAFDNCVDIGVNTIIMQVRPFSDAIYPSAIYPWSHILTGTQGVDPGYDPLEIMVQEAHNRNLAFEAWINPYRIKVSEVLPSTLAENNPSYTYPDWVKEVNGAMYFNPAIAEVQDFIVQGVLEIVNNYDVDGIQFDDYFYPTTDPSFDAEEYAAMGNGQSLDEWRRSNVNTLVSKVYSAIKQADASCIFGISPQGNNDNNYNGQYSDVKLWLSQTGYVDYIMPQIYWGFGYTMSNGSQRYAFDNCVAEWESYERHPDVALAIGLGAYRIGAGDGGNNDQSQWSSGHNLADMIEYMKTSSSVDGYAFYRYANLFDGSTGELQTQEREAIKNVLLK